MQEEAMNRALSLSVSSIAILALSTALSSSAEAHRTGFKSPSPGMHFTEGQPLVVYADLLDDREWKGLIVCPNGQTVANKQPPPDYSAPRVAQCSGGATPTGWPQFQVLVDGAPQADTLTGLMTVPNTISFDHNGNDSPIDLFPFSVKGVRAGTHQVVIRGFFSADAVTIATVDSPPVTVVVDPAPAKTVVQLNATTATGTINWNNVIVVGNGNAVTASGPLVIKNSLVTGISGFTGTVSSIDIEGSTFEDVGNMTLSVGSGSATILNNEWRANNRLTFAPDNPSVPFIFNFNGSGSAQKTFQGNRVGAGQLGFTGSNWLIGGDTDAAGNVIIGPRGVLNCGISNSVVRGNYDHHVYSPGMWSQGFNFSFINSGANVLIEHNFIRDASWPVQNLVGEFRYNVIFGYGHTWLRTAASGTSIHHNLWVPGGNDEVFNGFQDYLGETGLTVYNNTFDGGGTTASFAGPFLAMTGGSQVRSFRNNLITFASNMLNSNPGVTAIQGGASSYLYADYNSFYSPDNSNKTNYDFSPAGAHDVSGTGALGVANGQLSATPFAGARVTADDTKNIERTIEGVIDESAVWQGMQGISRVLAIFRERYTPKAGSPVIDRGDPQDNDSQGRKADIGAIDSNGHDQDKLGKFGTPPSETVPPTVALTAPSAGATLTGTATVSATAMDNAGGSGVVLVQFLVDGGVVAQSASSPYTATFNSAGFVNGSHAFSARAWDAAGNTALSPVVTATTMNMTMVVLPPPPGMGGAGGSSSVPGTGGSSGGAGGQTGSAGAKGQMAGNTGSNNGVGGTRGVGGNGSGEKTGGVSGGCGCSAGQGPADGTASAISLALLIGLVIRRRSRRGS
jgi:MYXO-CTERM domain-containing protein